MPRRQVNFPQLPENAPASNRRFSRWLGRVILQLLGWRIEGELPDIKQLVLAAGPHTSNWDFFIAMFAKMAIGVHFSYLMKKEAFFWPFKGLFMRMGGIPIDRTQAADVVEQIATWYQEHDKVWVAITPEGTRSKVTRWKTGFLRIAERAQVPVLIVTWDYPKRVLYIDKLWPTTGNHEQDAEAIRQHVCELGTGRHPKFH